MKINKVSQFNSFVRNTCISYSSPEKNSACASLDKSSLSIPASVYKANFMPAFGKYKKVRDIQLLDKDTEKLVKASLCHDALGDFSMYKIFVGRQEAGFMDMKNDAVLPEIGCLSVEPDNNIPEVRHIRSILGDRYAGIGTELIKAAVEESEKIGKNGSLWLETEQGYAASYSKHRRYENPIPFYYKLGFRAPDDKVNSLIEKYIKSGNYSMLPSDAVLILSSQDVYNFKKYYSTHYTYNDKSD